VRTAETSPVRTGPQPRLGGLLGAIGVQWLVTKIFLRDVADDEWHDLRRRMGLE
jgi:hypothetical protein